MNEQLIKPITEATYLTVPNAWRYRTILRYFYQQHERLRHYLALEEIFLFLKDNPYFRDYTEDQLQQDLDQLVQWKNLIPRQDTGRVSSIEEFKKRKFRYQLTPYSIEIERMVINLEHLGNGFGGSLEPTLFDRLLENLLKVTATVKALETTPTYTVFELSDEAIHLLWQDIYDDFRRLTENAADYLGHLQSEKVEELMLTEAFLVYKEALTEYLRNFMTSLQRTSYRIEGALFEVSAAFPERMAARLTAYELAIPRMDIRPTREQLNTRFQGEWDSLKTWFLGDGSRESDLIYLQNASNEAIRRLTRFAQRLGETHHSLRNRRMDYLHLAGMFARMDSIKEAHELSACVFGAFHTRHLWVEQPKQTDSYDLEVWDEPAAEVQIRPKIRAYHEKTRPNAVIDQSARKNAAREDYLRERASEEQLLSTLRKNDQIVLRNLPEVSSFMRKTLLSWIGKCMLNSKHQGKTETGQTITLTQVSQQAIFLRCEDGDLEMPDFILSFEQRAEAAR